MTVTISDIAAAEAVIRPHIRRTPVIEVNPGDVGISWRGRLTLKLECLQHTGSFKTRGAFATLLSAPKDGRGFAAVSGGNHGAAVACAAATLGEKAVIFVPEYAPQRKIDKIRAHGPDLRVTGATIAETMAAYGAFVVETDAHPVHPYDAPMTVAGQGTVGLEWAGQSPDLDAVLVAIGGGGLISGVGVAMAAGPAVIGVEPVGAACAHKARRAGRPVEAVPTSFARDSLGAPSLGPLTHALIDAHVDELLLVEDDAIRAAQAALWRQCCVAAEPGGATALAALISGAVTPEPGAHIGVLVCGANFDPAALSA
ncbi:MAG: serine/threonine dehydratase [Pikeienuella sp.]